jgi:hypothetical protein
MIKISIITPIRENLNELHRMMESLEATTENLEEIEVVLVIDKCDKLLSPMVPDLQKKYKKFNLHFHKVDRSEHFVKDYYNFAAKKAIGRWILAINIDVIFMTPSWDRLIASKMEAAAEIHKDDILYGIVRDGLPREGDPGLEGCKKAIWHRKVDFSCWILTSKAFVNFYGGMMNEINWLWGADHWTGLTWQQVLSGSRVVMIRDVFIDHISHHVKDLPQPPSFQYFCSIMRKHPPVCTQEICNQDARRIEAHIESLHAGAA